MVYILFYVDLALLLVIRVCISEDLFLANLGKIRENILNKIICHKLLCKGCKVNIAFRGRLGVSVVKVPRVSSQWQFTKNITVCFQISIMKNNLVGSHVFLLMTNELVLFKHNKYSFW